MKRLFIFGVCVLVVLCMASCYPEGPDYVHEKDIALTHYDEEADLIITTMKVRKKYRAPVITGSAYLTGLNEDSVTAQILDILKA